MAGKIQRQDVKTEADLLGLGASASDLINDTQIYVSALGLNKTLDDAIVDGDIGAGGDFLKQTFVLSGTDISNQYLDLSTEARINTINAHLFRSRQLTEGASYDFTVNYTGGVAGVTRISFVNDISSSGATPLVVGDVLQIQFVQQ